VLIRAFKVFGPSQAQKRFINQFDPPVCGFVGMGAANPKPADLDEVKERERKGKAAGSGLA
jgi:hypothetical protein